MIRKANNKDILNVVQIYNKILELEAVGKSQTGWQKGVYPTDKTAIDALKKGHLFVMEIDGAIIASAKINQEQVPEYANCKWEFEAPDNNVMVIHTLVVDPDKFGNGYATEFVRFYEKYALEHDCQYLRMDTNATNYLARRLYKKLGYSEPGIVSCSFNGIEDVKLVCLEKRRK